MVVTHNRGGCRNRPLTMHVNLAKAPTDMVGLGLANHYETTSYYSQPLRQHAICEVKGSNIGLLILLSVF